MIDTESPELTIATPLPGEIQPKAWIAIVGGLVYPAALLASLSIWLFAIRAPLWLDETLSYWQVSGGFGKVWSRSELMPSSIGYLYTLWLAKSILGSSEIALKIPSTLALLGAVYFLFRLTRELFGRETAYIACIFFSVEGSVVFAATDARPYAFALLATTLASFAFVRWIVGRRMRQAIWFGISASAILYFHYLFAAILPAFAIYYLLVHWRSIKSDLRQLAAVLASFTLLSLPLLYRVLSLFQTRQAHIVLRARHPGLVVLNTLAPQLTVIGLLISAAFAALMRKIRMPRREEFPVIFLGFVFALVPAGILIVISTVTAAHLLIPRYLSVAAPGAALMWALLTSRIDSKWIRQIFCLGMAATTLFGMYQSPLARRHDLNFKQAYEFVNANVKQDEQPVLVCSAFIESNYGTTPRDGNSENALFSQMSYYPIHAPVVLLPLTLNDETVRVASKAVLAAAQRRTRFLVIAVPDSLNTLDWLANYSRGAFVPRVLGNFDDVVIAEFQPIGTD